LIKDMEKTKEQLILELIHYREQFQKMTSEQDNSTVIIENDNRISGLNKLQLEELLFHLPTMAYKCLNNEDWTMVYVSDGCHEVTGYKASELTDNLQIAYSDLVHPADSEELWNKCQRHLQLQTPCDNIYRIVSKFGEDRLVRDQAKGVYAKSGELLFIVGFITSVHGV
jgi:PAS domain S-box-containing protein